MLPVQITRIKSTTPRKCKISNNWLYMLFYTNKKKIVHVCMTYAMWCQISSLMKASVFRHNFKSTQYHYFWYEDALEISQPCRHVKRWSCMNELKTMFPRKAHIYKLSRSCIVYAIDIQDFFFKRTFAP